MNRKRASTILLFIIICLTISEFLQLSAGFNQNNGLGASLQSKENIKENQNNWQKGSEILESDEEQIRIDKSNILLLGPTGSGINFH